MALGVRYNIGEINATDTAELKAALRLNEGVVPQDDISGVDFLVQKPDGTVEGPFPGQIEDDGQGYLQWTDTTQPGEYLAQAQFTTMEGEIRSVMVNFTVVNPFDLVADSPEALITEEVWARLEDSFDSVEGGPALREWTLANFDQTKIARFIPDALLDINVQMPPTHSVLADYTVTVNGEPNPIMPLLVKGVLCKTIQHLMRSYAEQPLPQGAQIVYEDRTRYTQTWQQIYAVEHEDFYTMVRLYKRQLLGLGHSALLVGSKAGRLFFGGSMRTRNVGRGTYW